MFLGQRGGFGGVEGGFHQLLLAVQPGQLPRLFAQVGPAGLEEGGFGVVLQLQVQNPAQLFLEGLAPDGAGDLHPPLEVSGHQVG